MIPVNDNSAILQVHIIVSVISIGYRVVFDIVYYTVHTCNMRINIYLCNTRAVDL